MAAAVVSVLGKLADVIAKEAQFLGGVGTKVELVHRELTRIKCCLKDADSKCKGDERVQNWLNELRDVAYRIEDATDTFFLKVGYRDASFLQKLKVYNMPKEMYFRHKLGNELDDIQNVLKEISNSRVTYGIRDLPLEDKSKGEAVNMPHRRATYYEVNENQIVGMQADKDNVLKLLHPEQTTRVAVITIVGPGGLGKTTLACMVYRSAKADFDYHIMLSVSQQFSLTDLLRKMISKYNNSVPKDRDVDYYVDELNSYLSGKRYLIILDDVWDDHLWNNELKYVLPDDKNGSRVLMTSRSIEVEKSAEYETISYELKILDDGKSLDLLLKKALPYQEPDKEYPTDLLQLALELSKKCKGLPLALVVLGGILSKEPSYPTWKRMLQNMNWHLDGMMPILAMSYEDLPYYLKACFQYLASFPEDYVISARCLIRMWVAEEFIPLENRPTVEIMAEDCLEELAKRSMVQVLSRSTNGLIKNFKVHDILRDLAIHEAGHENFITVFSHESVDKKPNRIIRRASLQAQEKNSRFMEYVGPNTRSLLLFEIAEYPKMSLHCSNFRLLNVLNIVGIRTMKDLYVLKSLDKLIHLKYLGIRDCEVDLFSFSFHRMKKLETLNMRGSVCRNLCGDFWTIGTLMHVLVNEFTDFAYAPISKTTLSNLQTLKWVRVGRAWDAKLPNLRKLGIVYNSNEWISITNLLQTLPFLVSLGIFGIDLPMEIIFPKALPNYQNLQSLHLRGKWPENVNVEASLLPPHLIKLKLEYSDLNHNPMPELGKLNSLKKLHLGLGVLTDELEGPIICPEGFSVLQHLIVKDKTIMVAQGVMPKLTYLQVHSKINLHLPPELQHVTVETFLMFSLRTILASGF